jgi:hypothetical protein
LQDGAKKVEILKGTMPQDGGRDETMELLFIPKLRSPRLQIGRFYSYYPASSASIDVIQGSKIRRILPTLGFQLVLSLWHITVPSLPIAHVQISSIRAANVRGLVFTANCHKSRLSHLLETAGSQTWQFAVKRRPIATVEEKLDFYIGIIQKWAQISVRNLNPDQDGYGPFYLIRILEGAMAVQGAI